MKVIIAFFTILFIVGCGTGKNTRNKASRDSKDTTAVTSDDLKTVIDSEVDTLSKLELTDIGSDSQDYVIVHLLISSDDADRIRVIGGGKEMELTLPIPDQELKNFSLDSIQKTGSGFALLYSYGGGDFLHSTKLLIEYQDDSFTLIEREHKMMQPSQEEPQISSQSFNPPIPFEEINILKIEGF